MSKYLVLATPRSFAKNDPAPIRLLEENDCEVMRLPKDGGQLEDQLAEYLPKADAVIAGLEEYNENLLQSAKKLKIISRYGVGYDKVDVAAAYRLGIKVSNTPGANSDAVADLAISLMLAAARSICPMDATIRKGENQKPVTGVEMWKKTLGVVGTGRIGKGVIERASGFQMNILANDAYPDPSFIEKHHGKYVDLDELVAESDFISLHAPLTEETRNMIDERRLNLMKPHAVLVNTARGGLIDTEALIAALKAGKFHAVARPLASLPNCILTPHAGAATYEAGKNMGLMAAQNVLDVLSGKECPYLV